MRRDADPYPWTWEVPVACLSAFICVGVAALQVGRSLAFVADGQGWVWPVPDQLIVSVPQLLAGVNNAGLETGVAPISTVIFLCATAMTELVAIVVVTLLSWQLVIRFGPWVISGLASAAEANRLLGRLRLARARRVVRPDLDRHAIKKPTQDDAS